MEHENITLRILNQADSAALAALEAVCFPSSWNAAQFSTAFQQPVFAAFGAFYIDQLIAYISAYRNTTELEILNVAVHPEQRDKKIASLLLGHVLQAAEKAGIQETVLEVRPSNTPAIRLYTGLGFQKIGLRKGYYPDTKEDAAVYCRKFLV